jgi:hypothetical protein
MTSASPESSMESSEQHENDLMNMVEEIGTAVAAGLVPFVSQAINIYDTIESLLTLHNSKSAEDQAEAKFDLVLALVGWIPGAGAGVKKTIRIVNKNPARYAPILFDVLRMVCLKLGIQTSPETLLEKLFDAAGLKAVLGTAQTSVEKSWAYEQLPSEGQMILSSSMAAARSSLPSMVMLVTTKLLHWKRLQRNTAARSAGTSKNDSSAKKPAAKKQEVAQEGANAPANASSNTARNDVVGTAPLTTITNTVTGILGEHITDYFLYEEYGWGKNWNDHDLGGNGSWEIKPGKISPGKLNEGTKLNPLLAMKAHGVGIDGVWKVQIGDPHNHGKPYAIVESKASANNNAPANASRKPNVTGKLLTNSRRIMKAAAAAALPPTEALLDPPTNGSTIGATKPSMGRVAGSSRNKRNADQGKQTTNASSQSSKAPVVPAGEKPVVQMSQDWIDKNIRIAVSDREILADFRTMGIRVYSRHIFFTPFYLPVAAKHLKAIQAKDSSAASMHASHEGHSIPSTHRHGELEVKRAVNSKLRRLNLQPET